MRTLVLAAGAAGAAGAAVALAATALAGTAIAAGPVDGTPHLASHLVSGVSGASGASGTTVAGTPGRPGPLARLHRGHRPARLARLARVEHAKVTLRTKDGGSVTRTIWVGTVTAVSGSSLTVQAADGTSATYKITSTTKVLDATTEGQRPSSSDIGSVATGDRVAAGGTGSSSLTARRVVELPAK